MEILFNEVYIGKVINNKTADNLDTGHRVVRRDVEDWIVVEDDQGMETLSALSVLDEFDPDKIRQLVSQVLVHSKTEIEIVWKVDDFIAQA